LRILSQILRDRNVPPPDRSDGWGELIGTPCLASSPYLKGEDALELRVGAHAMEFFSSRAGSTPTGRF
jgi:hypothetical protein